MTKFNSTIWAGTLALVALLTCSTSQAQTPQTPAPPAAQPFGRTIKLITASGSFQEKWDSFEGALTAAAGNGYNQTLRRGDEIIVLNSRCEGEVSYSLFAVPKTMQESIKKLQVSPLRGTAFMAEQQKVVDDFLVEMEKNKPAKPLPCDPVAVEIVAVNGKRARLEHYDVGSPLVGGRINDAYVFEATRLGKARSATVPGSTPLTGGVVNGFKDIKAAMLAASQLEGTEVAVMKAKKIYLYRSTNALMDLSSDEAKLAPLKAAKPAKSLTILGIMMGSGANTKMLRTDGR